MVLGFGVEDFTEDSRGTELILIKKSRTYHGRGDRERGDGSQYMSRGNRTFGQ